VTLSAPVPSELFIRYSHGLTAAFLELAEVFRLFTDDGTGMENIYKIVT